MVRPSIRRILLCFSLSAIVAASAGNAFAQQDGSPRRSRSLSDRLEQFRRDLMGTQEDPYLDRPSSAVPASRPPRSTRASQTTTRQASVGNGPTPAKPREAQASGQPASRMVRHSRVSEDDRLAMKPRESSQSEPMAAPTESDTVPYAAQPAITDETRRADLAPTTARPASRRGAFELPTPRVARSEAAEANDALQGEAADSGALRPALRTATNPSAKASNVLFSAQNPMLSVSATGPRTVLVGRESKFQMVVRNVGEVLAEGAVVKINVPPFVEIVSAEASGGSAVPPAMSDKAGVLEWKLDRIDVGQRETLDLRLIPRKNVPLDLSAAWACTPRTMQAIVQVQQPQLSLSLSGPREIFYGQSKIYKLTIANPGNGDAENVSVRLLPIGNSNDAPGTHQIGRLPAGDSKTIDIELTARQAGELQMQAQAFGDGGLRADVAEPVVVRRAQLKIAVAASKVKYAGTPSLFRVRVANAGDAVAEGVELAAVLPPGAKVLEASHNGEMVEASGQVVWNLGAMQPGDDRTFDVHCTLSVPGENAIQATVQSSGDLTASASAVTRVEALADLELAVKDPRGPVAIGSDAEYKVVVRNRGTKAAEGIDIITFFSEGLEATNVVGAEHEIATGQVVVRTIPTLAAGAEVTIGVTCKADRGGNLVFRAEVACRNPGTKLAAEETTHFYGDEILDEAPTAESASLRAPGTATR